MKKTTNKSAKEEKDEKLPNKKQIISETQDQEVEVIPADGVHGIATERQQTAFGLVEPLAIT
ncbi:MAG: hypothetical protein Q7T50_06560, partial [Candidatus Magasanikbacteria bacterium]|nr:hypothetical protein [Candidatus Magasanikbacteria bacterium]